MVEQARANRHLIEVGVGTPIQVDVAIARPLSRLDLSQTYYYEDACGLHSTPICISKAKLDQTQLLTGPNNQAKIHCVAGIIF